MERPRPFSWLMSVKSAVSSLSLTTLIFSANNLETLTGNWKMTAVVKNIAGSLHLTSPSNSTKDIYNSTGNISAADGYTQASVKRWSDYTLQLKRSYYILVPLVAEIFSLKQISWICTYTNSCPGEWHQKHAMIKRLLKTTLIEINTYRITHIHTQWICINTKSRDTHSNMYQSMYQVN